MSWFQGSLGLDVVIVVGWAILLGSSYFVLLRTLELLPLGQDQRTRLSRLQPIVGLVIALLFCLMSAHTLFERHEQILPIALLLVLVGFFVGSRNLVRDFFAGVAMRAENSCSVGDHVRIGETRGKIIELGPRAIVLETPEGDKALMPYSQASQLPVVQTRAVERGASHTFSAAIPSQMSFAQAVALIERTALCCHFASIARPPETVALDSSKVEVTIFALSPDYTDEVETAVRSALKGSTRS